MAKKDETLTVEKIRESNRRRQREYYLNHKESERKRKLKDYYDKIKFS